MLSRKQRELLKNRAFLKIWIGMLFSSTGNWFRMIAATTLIYKITGSGFMVSVLWIVSIVPSIIFAPPAGILIDRSNRRRLMILSDIVRAVLIFSLMYFSSHLLGIYTIFFLVSSMGLLFSGSYESFFPFIIERENLLAGNSLQKLSESVSVVLGPILAGVAIRFWGIKMAFLIDGITYLFSALCIFLISTTSSLRDKGERVQRSHLGEIRDTVIYIKKERVVKTLLIMGIISMLGFGAYSSLLVVYANDALNSGVTGYGALYSADAMGSIIGALALAFLAKFIKKKGAAIALGYSIISLTTLMFAYARSMGIAISVLIFEGIFLALSQTNEETVLQEIIPDEYRGRVFLGLGALVNIATLLSMAAAGIVNDFIGIRNVFLLASMLCAVSASIGWWKIRKI